MSDWPGVFVSSTCYDLIDLRAELEVHLRVLGLTPLMSDRASSDFEVSGNIDSIAACIENVKKSSSFICVLSQRYGPRLGASGFKPDVSATHLEYMAAREARIPIFFYARDRLMGEYNVWKDHREKLDAVKFRWVTKPSDHGLFELIDEHMKLKAGAETSNWVWAYQDSVELKERITLDLRRQSVKARLRRLIDAGRIATVVPQPGRLQRKGETLVAMFDLLNAGPVPALNITHRVGTAERWNPVGNLLPGGSASSGISWRPPPSEVPLRVSYANLAGEVVEDDYVFFADEGGAVHIEHKAKRLTGDSLFTIE